MTTGMVFIDTNIWLYAFIRSQDQTKTQKAKALITSNILISVSVQVINEVCVNVLRKEKLPETDIRDIIEDFYALYHIIPATQAQQVHASHLRQRYSISFWDGLILASALASGTDTLFSEDMQHGLRIENQLTIVNPFR